MRRHVPARYLRTQAMSARDPSSRSGATRERGVLMAGTRTVWLLAVAAALGTAGCPLLAEDDFVLSAGATTAGQGGSGSEAGAAGMTAAGGSSVEPTGGSAGAEEPPPAACAPCADGEQCRADVDCQSGRCSSAGTCRACGLRLTSVQTACPASCTRCEAGTCFIECASEGACKEATLACPPNVACQIACTGAGACENASATCPAEFPCDVSCNGKRACKGMTVSCGSGPCEMACTADSACEAMSLRCGDDRCEAKCSGGAVAPQVACEDSCDCATCSG
jgi:hypothetical protein